ncbi:phosphoglycolate phosphatase [Isoptericola sp. CG 20/1183]|uniref:Phosphoglycolate phosphatase n=1 Tax=Isoptericola halotolerans TaxID=300560 RepID=A0ABX5EIM1_9MICO|nr:MULTISPECIES: HAD hydrolase-like protein [Isoptericola]PRZ09529.1 phosphoglycolate phosphatase [Isoptericola sp. CG 20/1183]PRZ10330.1 phosphoglycolate phosphatase [Isoptericola halotolerans]
MTTPLVLLDLDGTLMDSAPGITASAAHAYRTLGLPVPDAATLRSFVGPPITDSFPTHGVPRERVGEALVAYRAAFTAGGMFNNSVFDGVPAALRELRAAGCVLAVATSKPEVFARPICERFGLSALVDDVFGAPLDEATSTKADVIAKALAALGRQSPAAPEDGPVLMVGDREHDVHGAAEHGIGCLGVSWGYAAPGELERAGVVGTVDDVADLAAQVLARLR